LTISAHKTAQPIRTPNACFSPSDFNGKEKDHESGFHYYGARYYWCEVLTGWLSVDPLADKYPSLSPYNYCGWNPVLFIDPNGREKVISFSNTTSDNRIACAAENSPNNEPVIHLWAHGNKNGVQTYNQNCVLNNITSPSDMHEFLNEESALYQNNTENNTLILVMHSCLTGQGDDNIAKEISSGLNLLVVAPTESIQIQTENEGMANENSHEIGTMKISKKTGKPDKMGVWNVYYKGVLVDALSQSTSPTFNDPKSTIEKYEKIYQQKNQD
jgi:RHS repeat-associated protein